MPKAKSAPASGSLTHEHLKNKQRALRAAFTDDFGLRIHRALSWLGRAEKEEGDPDIKFILLWICFNSAYAADIEDIDEKERLLFKAFFKNLVRLDKEKRIYKLVWQRFTQEIRVLVSNPHVFSPFWKHHNGIGGFESWQILMENSQKIFAKSVSKEDTPQILSIIFDRLYVLRNQLIHGGATWNGSVNRSQVKDGAAVLSALLPVFIDIMMDNHSNDWGKPYYPVVDTYRK